MTKGGYHPQARLEQDLAEVEVGAAVYVELDAREDELVDSLLGWLRRILAGAPAMLAQLEAWERAWRLADGRADRAVSEIRELAHEASSYAAALG